MKNEEEMSPQQAATLGQRLISETQTLRQEIKHVHTDLGEVKAAMMRLSDAITKLALVEDRQARTSAALEKAWAALADQQKQIANQQTEIANLRLAISGNTHAANDSARWWDRVLWAALAACAMYIAKAVNFLK